MNEQQERQALFDISLNHIRAQGGPSMKDDSCMYRGENGRSCAAAPFITDFQAGMEGNSFRELAASGFRPYLDPLAVKHRYLVGDLQDAHDEPAVVPEDSVFMAVYEKEMADLAKYEQLHYTPPEVAQ